MCKNVALEAGPLAGLQKLVITQGGRSILPDLPNLVTVRN